ncbi:MAG TPA: hypothetical protein VGA22_10220 [Gemmatimonadales bacterium]|jgi:Tol biopolymer transport system component
MDVSWTRPLTIASVLLATGAAFSPAEAQYFGRNKLQFQSFEFEVLATEHFDIYYYAEEEPAVEFVALMSERWYARLARVLNHDLSIRQPLIVYASPAQFRQTNTLQGDLGESTGGVTEILKRRIVLPLAGPLFETDHVLGHELAHAFQFDITGEGGGIAMAGVPAIMRYPLWFTEGMAEYLSLGPVDPNTAMWMRDAVREELPNLQKLSDPRFFPYRYGHALWSYIAGRWGDDVIGRILKASRSAGNPSIALSRILRMRPDSMVAEWHKVTREHFSDLREETAGPEDYGRLLTTKESGAQRVNLAPALSPDGSRVAFFSERGLFSIDMYVADVATGEILRRVTRTDVDPHFESIQFINSAGAWDATGRLLAFTAVNKGRPVLTVLDVESGDLAREVRIEEAGEIFNPAWAPDGKAIAFTALAGGLSDLFVYDLERDELRRLTNDGYAELHPAWSPDGSRIAIATDRFSMGLSSLLFGAYQLALVNPTNGRITRVPGFPRGKHINPQWTPDGSGLYFVGEPNGIPNLYRIDLESGSLLQITNLFTGISGITSLSPAISIAQETGEVAITVYERDIHRIWMLESPEVLAGGAPITLTSGVDPAYLPPVDRLTNEVYALVSNAFYGLPSGDGGYVSDAYRPKLSLDYISQPSFGVAVDRYGTFIAGGASLFWSDMLGGHNLVTGLQAQGSLKDIAALVGYTNLNRRLDWGVAVQQAPVRQGYITFDQGSYSGQSAIREQTFIFRQTARQLSGFAAYPLSRTRRIEASAGLSHISYDYEVRDRIYVGSFVAVDSQYSLPAPDPLSFGQGSLALVYDNSFWGWTSPVLGQRYRLEVGGMVGSLDMVTGLADVRKYVMPTRPFTIAGRLMHYGRYGPDGGSERLQPLFLGYDGLVRGFSYNSFDFSQQSEIDKYPSLFGSKILVANLEFRVPPLALSGGSGALFGAVPIELIVFGDAGIAWGQNSLSALLEQTPEDVKPFFSGGLRKPIYSAGAGLRANILGFMVIEIDYVYPFGRERGPHFQFGFVPGF